MHDSEKFMWNSHLKRKGFEELLNKENRHQLSADTAPMIGFLIDKYRQKYSEHDNLDDFLEWLRRIS